MYNIYFKAAKPLANYKQSHRSSIYRKKKKKKKTKVPLERKKFHLLGHGGPYLQSHLGL